jgi:hypothetical protein
MFHKDRRRQWGRQKIPWGNTVFYSLQWLYHSHIPSQKSQIEEFLVHYPSLPHATATHFSACAAATPVQAYRIFPKLWPIFQETIFSSPIQSHSWYVWLQKGLQYFVVPSINRQKLFPHFVYPCQSWTTWWIVLAKQKEAELTSCEILISFISPWKLTGRK